MRPRTRVAPEGDPLVSCVVIFHNEERFLADAVESVFSQKYRRWELLLVDDGSSDGSTALARGYAERRPAQVRYVEHEGHRNAGMSATRNLGIAHARGTYLAFLDADDVWLPKKLEEQVALFQTYPEAAMVCGSTLVWHGWTGRERDAQEDSQEDFLMRVGAPQDRLWAPSPLHDVLVRPPALLTKLYPLGDGASPSTSNYLLKKEVVERVGGFEDRFRGMYEDQAFQVKVYLHAPVYVAAAWWDRYRQHPGSCQAAAVRDGRKMEERRTFLAWLQAYLEAERVSDPEVWRAYRAALWPYRHPILFRIRTLVWRALPTAWFSLLQRALRRLRHVPFRSPR